jgi:uncharacterized protein YhhL (DUF1145 family)
MIYAMLSLARIGLHGVWANVKKVILLNIASPGAQKLNCQTRILRFVRIYFNY